MEKELSEEDINCKKYRELKEYSNLQTLIDNIPYIMMTFFGAVIFIVSFNMSLLGWIFGVLFILYGILGAFWIIIFVCPYCHYYDTKACPCGYGQIAGKFLSQKDGDLFFKKFRKHVPVLVPLWIIPVIVGLWSLITSFTWIMVTLIVIFAVDSFLILPLVSRRYGCAHCPQKDTCPWMGSRSSKRKSATA
ncbi:MAG: hypothetical protein JSV09_14545 [Thermoplasmata archaeon]|nr:MAG: hypothetical protein JSV09_14545 [Thermoplasmata archaeon]